MTTWPKTCGCCARVYDATSWAALPYVGVQTFDDGGPAIEFRNCECKTTLAIELPADDVADEAA